MTAEFQTRLTEVMRRYGAWGYGVFCLACELTAVSPVAEDELVERISAALSEDGKRVSAFLAQCKLFPKNEKENLFFSPLSPLNITIKKDDRDLLLYTECHNATQYVCQESPQEKENIIKKKNDPPYDADFLGVWDAYGKKVSRITAVRAWSRLNKTEKEMAKKHIPYFVEATPEIQFRPYLATYLNQKRFLEPAVTKEGDILYDPSGKEKRETCIPRRLPGFQN